MIFLSGEKSKNITNVINCKMRQELRIQENIYNFEKIGSLVIKGLRIKNLDSKSFGILARAPHGV